VEGRRLERVPKVHMLAGERARQGFLEDGQLAAILEHLRAELRAPIRFLRMTGWREGEALGLEWARVDWAGQEIRLDTSKNGQPRALPFSTYPALGELLLRQRESADTVQRTRGVIVTHVFHHEDGRPFSQHTLQSAWAKARVKAGFPHALIHDLRRTVVRELERTGVPRSVAMKITGHQSEAVYRRYAIVARRDVEDGLARLAAAQPAPSTVVPFKRAEGA